MTSDIDYIDLAFTRKTGKTGIQTEPTYSGALSFARRRYSKDLAGADVAVVGLPFDLATTSRPGSRYGPRGVRQASSMIAWDRIHGWDFDPFEKLSVIDYGDVLFDHGSPEAITATIENTFSHIHKTGVKTLMLGGDHFSTYPVLKSIAAQIGKPLSLIHFDAHSDTWSEDMKRVDHGTMFYHAAKEGLVDPAHSVQIGIRTYNPEDHGFNILSAEDVAEQGVAATVKQIRGIVGDNPAYLTFDIDCLDPSFAPGTGTPVIGGLTSMEAQQILRGLAGIDLVSADVVEVAPAYDTAEITSLAAATLAMNCLALFAASQRPEA